MSSSRWGRHVRLKRPCIIRGFLMNVIKQWLTAQANWIRPNLSIPSFKPVVRCSVVAFASVVLFVIPAVERALGSASFLLLIAAFLSQPADPFLSVLEREILILLFICTTWAWVCFGLFLANLARSNRMVVPLSAAISGRYLEAGPTVIVAVFLFLGSFTILYIKARQGPGNFIFPCVFGCICLDIAFTTAVLLPFPYYEIGKTIAIPVALHSALALTGSLLIFPSSISNLFRTRLSKSLRAMQGAIQTHRQLLLAPLDPDLHKALKVDLGKLDGGFVPLAAAARLLHNDIVYSNVRPKSLEEFQALLRRATGRINGMGGYFHLVQTGLGDEHGADAQFAGAPGVPLSPHPTIHAHTHHHHHHRAHNHEHRPLSAVKQKSRWITGRAQPRWEAQENPVGAFESLRYVDLGANLRVQAPQMWADRQNMLLARSCQDMVSSCDETLGFVIRWVSGESEEDWAAAYERGQQAVAKFRSEDRHIILEMYNGTEHPPRRYLFNAYLYQYHLIQLSSNILSLLRYVVTLESTKSKRLWTPIGRIHWFSMYRRGAVVDALDELGDDNPDVIEGLHDGSETSSKDTPMTSKAPSPSPTPDLGLPFRRDPDALPARNRVEWTFAVVYAFVEGLSSGNVLFALKAGVMSVAMCLPFFFSSSSQFAYENRFQWAVIMGQLTLARFRGDTAFGFFARIIGTFLGGVTGAVMWYISAGSGTGNPYGLCAVCAVCFPIFFFTTMYAPIKPMTAIVFLVTTALVITYSYVGSDPERARGSTVALTGNGWQFAWRRFLLVTVGVTCAFIMSFLPPTTTIRYYTRHLLATTSAQLGSIYCSLLSLSFSQPPESSSAVLHASNDDVDRSGLGREGKEVARGLIAIRAKIRRSDATLANVAYEVSARGRWPVKRYRRVGQLQMELSLALAHLLSVLGHLRGRWTVLFFERMGFWDARFQGEVLAVISMISSSLRTGAPLPQITPCPLIERFVQRGVGLSGGEPISRDGIGFGAIYDCKDFVIPGREGDEETHVDPGSPGKGKSTESPASGFVSSSGSGSGSGSGTGSGTPIDGGEESTSSSSSSSDDPHINMDLLRDEQYLIFSVGISTALMIIHRLDQLMLAVKEIVGEHYHLHGVGVRYGHDVEMASRGPLVMVPDKREEIDASVKKEEVELVDMTKRTP